MKITINKATTAKKQWLPRAQYSKLALHMIQSRLNAKDELSDTKFKDLESEISRYKVGETTAKGYRVSIRYLLGAMSKIAPELVERLVGESTSSTEESEYF